ncbi:CoA transferase [Amycolatopsis acidicola]|uniref:CoA transferase n=1 Tax=Amycolatopsis acidicola TaxID=2596893 RepID=A0A5N0V409_9PSEU|nr:CoA transferase [Amycolatopsis acidicola]KAA9160524.1 CoA transferase [Amycolatopsis acidicola]
MTATRGALEGVRILDLSRVLAGPHATMLLADLGADVVKVERKAGGDDTRTWGPPWHDGEATYFLGANRNKRSLCLDFTDAADLRTVRSLAARCDVLVENFRPGTLEKYGLGYSRLTADNPGLVYCSITGFGTHEGAHLPGYDLIAQAAGGLMSITGPPGEPSKAGVALVDVITGLHATIGIQAALRHRDATGEGQVVEVNLLSSLLSAMSNQSSAHVLTGTVPSALGNAHPSVAPYQPIRTADRPLAIAATTDRQFRALVTTIGRAELAEDERYGSNSSRVAHRAELIADLEATFTTEDADHWFKLLSARGVPCGPINDLGQAFQLAEELGLRPVVRTGDETRAVDQVANPITLSRTPATYRRNPPRLGADSGDPGWLGDGG